MKLRDGVYGLSYSAHGGSCCGISHLHSFPYFTASRSDPQPTHKEKVDWIRKAIETVVESEYEESVSYAEADTFHCGIEVVLIDDQLPTWEAALEAVGFVRVFRFLNSNSDNFCNVFYLENGA